MNPEIGEPIGVHFTCSQTVQSNLNLSASLSWTLSGSSVSTACVHDYDHIAAFTTVQRFAIVACVSCLISFVLGVLRLLIHRIANHKRYKHMFFFVLGSSSISLLISLATWGDIATHTPSSVLRRRRTNQLLKYLEILRRDVYENRTALVSFLRQQLKVHRGTVQSDGGDLPKLSAHLQLSWPFWVAVVAEFLLSIAILLFLMRRDCKVPQTASA
ncbi:hypothetical protein SprV_0200620400 [Sparganum proliferum]